MKFNVMIFLVFLVYVACTSKNDKGGYRYKQFPLLNNLSDSLLTSDTNNISKELPTPQNYSCPTDTFLGLKVNNKSFYDITFTNVRKDDISCHEDSSYVTYLGNTKVLIGGGVPWCVSINDTIPTILVSKNNQLDFNLNGVDKKQLLDKIVIRVGDSWKKLQGLFPKSAECDTAKKHMSLRESNSGLSVSFSFDNLTLYLIEITDEEAY